MDLLERDAALRELAAALDDARRGAGRVVLVGGEAGIGKTALVWHFAHAHRAARVLWGNCDALATPRPLGPLRDMAPFLPEALRGLLAADADRAALFAAVLAELQRRPAIVVVEDVHWADEATLDLLRFLGRRVDRTAALLVLTYRDDELEPRHPLRALLGDLASSATVRRVALPPLSEAAVRLLVGARPIDAAELHRRSGGNPFFVTESLAAGDDVAVPATVRDAVLARVARLSPLAHAVVQTAAVIGPRVEPWLLEAVAGGGAGAVEEGLAVGMLVAQGEQLAFRHELARQAVLEAIPPPRRAAIHRLALEALSASPDGRRDLARLAHLAAGAGDRAAVLEYAPAAARQAAAAGTHGAAAALFALALPHAEALPIAERAALLEAHAWESIHILDYPPALAGRRRAAELWRVLGDPLKQGENLVYLARALNAAGDRGEARQTCRAAIALLEALPHGRELALAYVTLALLCQYNHDLAIAIELAERAVALAEAAGDRRTVMRAYHILGLASMYLNYERGRQQLERARAIALDAGFAESFVVACGDLGSNSVELFHLEQAERDLADALAYAAERDLPGHRLYSLGWLAVAQLYRGRWPEAAAAAAEVLRARPDSDNARWAALLALGRLQARQDGVVAPLALDEALDMGLAWGEFQLIGPVRAARAEAAWLAGDRARTLAETNAIYDLAVAKRHPWVAGELAFWRWRAGDVVSLPDWLAEPFARQIAGDWRAAAETWDRLGCPYERARALADGDDAARAAALRRFQDLGARPAASALRRAMRVDGAAHIPRGPWRATRESRHGLTARQGEILDLLAEGLSNAAIAERLSIAPKTVDHHVSAILARLDVHSREAAVAQVRHQH